MSLLDVVANNFSSVITVVAAGGAYCVYYMEKRAHKRQAATIIIMDVRRIETLLSRLKANRSLDFIDSKASFKNSWEQYKHLFVTDMSPDGFERISNLFIIADEIKSFLNLREDLYRENLFEKVRITQQKLVKDDSSKPSEVMSLMNEARGAFDPNYPSDIIYQLKDAAHLVSSTVDFETLRKIAKIN
ncbi:TPA: hypothetical protein ACX6PV_000863 [Photobacterium damselae]